MIARRLSVTLLLLAGLLALLAMPSAADTTANDARGGVLRVARFDDVDSLDPALAYGPASWQLLYATCAKLFNHPDRPDQAGARVVPEIVERYTVSKDGRTYTFTLKQTFRFHTGARVTAQSFADAFNRNAQPRLGSPATPYMREILGAAAVIDGKAQSISGIRALDRYRLQIRLTTPVGDLPARLTMPFFCPILPNTPIDPDGIDNPAGSGPYFVAERVVNQRIVLKRNPYYRGARPANPDQIVYTVGLSPDECVAATEQDRIDLCFGPLATPESAQRRLAETYGINRSSGRYVVAPVLSTWYFAFNHDRPAFTGPGQIPLKQAINYALDRRALARAFGYLAGRRTDRMLPPAVGRTRHDHPLSGADLVTAKKLLARARLKPRELVLYTLNTSFGVGVAQVFAYNLKQIGIDVVVKYLDLGSLVEETGSREEPFDVVFSGWTVDYADPAGFFVPLLHGVSPQASFQANRSHVDDPTIDARIDAANQLTGRARRNAWADLDADLMRNNPPWAPILHRNHRAFVSRSVGCYFVHPVYRDDLAAVCKK